MPFLRVGHSPDADDAFMFYPLAKKIITIPGYEITHVLDEIQGLNHLAMSGELEVTAISAAVYPEVAHHYRIMPCGSSVGRKYGPLVVSKHPLTPNNLKGKTIGIPGKQTTANMLFHIFMDQPFKPIYMPFDQVSTAVERGDVDAGIFIHEGQILANQLGLNAILDLGEWWFGETNLPIPLGLDMVNRNIGDSMSGLIAKALQDAIIYSINNEDDALDYALDYGRGIDRETGRKFVRMYVNQDTVDFGDEGRKALHALYTKAADNGLISEVPKLDIIEIPRGSSN